MISPRLPGKDATLKEMENPNQIISDDHLYFYKKVEFEYLKKMLCLP